MANYHKESIDLDYMLSYSIFNNLMCMKRSLKNAVLGWLYVSVNELIIKV